MFKGLLIVAMATLAVSAAEAQKKNAGIIHHDNSNKSYGVAGCGLGSVLLGAKKGIIQVVAATINGTSANQTFGITFGTLNCDIPESGMQAAVYIENNREVVTKEAARGNGETLVGLANILKCSDQNAFNSGVQSNFEKVFVESSNAYSNVKSLMEVINNNEQLKASCHIAG